MPPPIINLSNKSYPINTTSTIVEIEKILRAIPGDNLNLIVLVTDNAGNRSEFTSEGFLNGGFTFALVL